MQRHDSESAAVRQISSRTVYRNRWLTLREDQVERLDGSRGVYSVIDRPDYTVVIPVERGGFHLVDQYRYPIAGRFWEFPQGGFPDGSDGHPVVLARAELAEETGLRARRLVHLGHLFGAHGISGQAFNVYLATDLEHGAPRREHEEQDMRHRWFSRLEVEHMICSGQIKDSATVAAYSLLLLHERAAAAPHTAA